MTVTPSGFGRGLIIAFVASIAVGGYLYRYLGLGNKTRLQAPTPASLVQQAQDALQAVKDRKLDSTLRPAKYDGILLPLDALLKIAKTRLEAADYDPVRDYRPIAECTAPVREIAQDAHQQSQLETSFLKKDYRFLEQKGDAARFQAAALWNKLEAEQAQKQSVHLNGPPPAFVPSVKDSEELYSLLSGGITAAPENKFLWYLRSVVRRANGAYAEAERDLRRALDLDGDFVAAWNDLGLLRINLRQFDQAEQDFTKAKDKAEEAARFAKVRPGDDYFAALLNLANLHQALAAYYARAGRMDASEENRAALARHVRGTREAAAAILAAAPEGSPYAREARRLESELP